MRAPLIFLAAALTAWVSSTSPLAAQTQFGTAFTYQGRMADMGGPGSGTYDVRFTLYDAFAGGTSKGTLTLNGVMVSGGLFTVALDFGALPFDGSARWLELAVQKMGGGFTTLSPRQALTAAPFAQTIFGRTVVVKPLGTSSQNGTQLVAAVNGVTTASASNRWTVKVEPGIYDVGAPGTLVMRPFVDLEGSGEGVTKITSTGLATNTAGTLTAANNMQLRFLTVENTGGGLAYARALDVNGTSPTIRHVTVLASGGTAENSGLYIQQAGANPNVSDLTARVTSTASGPSNGVLVLFGATGRLRNVESTSTGGMYATAYYVFASFPDVANVHGSATGASVSNSAFTQFGGSGTTIRNSAFDAFGGSYAFGIDNLSGSGLALEDVHATGTATSTGGFATGIHCDTASLSTLGVRAIGGGPALTNGVASSRCDMNLTRSMFIALGSGGGNVGVFAAGGTGGSYTVNIDRSTLQGGTNSITSGGTGITYNVHLGGSHLIGPTSLGVGTIAACASNWNAAYSFYASTCPP